MKTVSMKRKQRAVVAARGGVVLAETVKRDMVVLKGESDGLFDVDRDPRPLPIALPARRLTILDENDIVLGNVSWIPVVHGPTVACVAWNIGIMVLPTARGRGIGTLAQRLLIEHLFATTEIFRIEASTDVVNYAEQRALQKAGMRRDGTVRGAQLRGGVRRDIALFSILRSEL